MTYLTRKCVAAALVVVLSSLLSGCVVAGSAPNAPRVVAVYNPARESEIRAAVMQTYLENPDYFVQFVINAVEGNIMHAKAADFSSTNAIETAVIACLDYVENTSNIKGYLEKDRLIDTFVMNAEASKVAAWAGAQPWCEVN